MIATLGLLDPWFLIVIPVLGGLAVVRSRRPRAALPIAALPAGAILPRTLRTRLTWLPLALLTLGAMALGVALARPVAREVLPLREVGVELLLVIDLSSSMRSADMDAAKPLTRMEAARDKALEFVTARKSDRIALLTFARYPDLRCPPTLDHVALGDFVRGLRTVEPETQEDGTAIGLAVAQAVTSLGASPAKSKVVVLLSDGEETVPAVPHAEAAKLAKDKGIRVHTIGVGRGERTLFGVQKLEFKALRTIADVTGGRFFRAESAADLAQTYAEIDAMEKVEIEDPRYRTSELFLVPLIVGAGLLLVGFLLQMLWLGGVP